MKFRIRECKPGKYVWECATNNRGWHTPAGHEKEFTDEENAVLMAKRYAHEHAVLTAFAKRKEEGKDIIKEWEE